MTIKPGERLPEGKVQQYIETEAGGCSIGPNDFDVADGVHGRRIVIFGLPGAYTPTCSGRHVPGFVARYDDFRAAGIDEIWCLSVNDAYVMHAWGRDQQVGDRIQMIADGNCDYTRRLGLEVDLTARGMGWRSQRYAMLVEDGVVRLLLLEQPGQFEVSGAESVLRAMRE